MARNAIDYEQDFYAWTAEQARLLMQPAMRSTSWSRTIREQRRQIETLLGESPSLRPFVAAALAGSYADAREDAVEETGLPEGELPVECPFTADEALSPAFLPGG